MKTPHHKAFEYTYEFIDKDGIPCISHNYIAVVPGVDIEMLVRRWNMAVTSGRNYKLLGEVDLKTALYTRGINGMSIAVDWKVLDHMQFHTITYKLESTCNVIESSI